MAPVAGRPFLAHLLDYCHRQELTRIVLSVGYKWEVIRDHFGQSYKDMAIAYSVEDEPLGTGGGILKAFDLIEGNAFVLNGDSMFRIDLGILESRHLTGDYDMSIGLKRMHNFSRYGTVDLEDDRIIRFKEKEEMKEGLINAGTYLMNRSCFEAFGLEGRFSIEQDLFEKQVTELRIGGIEMDGYFIDIGIPEDFERAQTEMVD